MISGGPSVFFLLFYLKMPLCCTLRKVGPNTSIPECKMPDIVRTLLVELWKCTCLTSADASKVMEHLSGAMM